MFAFSETTCSSHLHSSLILNEGKAKHTEHLGPIEFNRPRTQSLWTIIYGISLYSDCDSKYTHTLYIRTQKLNKVIKPQ